MDRSDDWRTTRQQLFPTRWTFDTQETNFKYHKYVCIIAEITSEHVVELRN